MLTIAAVASASAANGVAPAVIAPQFVTMDPIVVPIIGSDHIDGALHVQLVLAATDEAAREQLTARLPELRAASVAGAIEFSRLYASARTPVNAVRLSRDLSAVLRAEDAGIARVLIVEVSAAE